MSAKRKRFSREKNVDYKPGCRSRGESVKKLANEFGVGEQTVRDLIKLENYIFKFISCAESSSELPTLYTHICI